MKEKKVQIFLISGLILLTFISTSLIYFFNNDFRAIRQNPFASSKLNILVLGFDDYGPSRADTIILASIDLDTNNVGFLSIPRDTRVEIPGRGVNRVNAAHAFGGAKLSVATIENLLEVPIDYYVETDFQGFAKIIDIIGGVEVDIAERMYYVDKAGGLYIDLAAGRQKLDGEKALQYVRYREPLMADIGRVERQQKFIKAVIEKVLRPDIVTKLPAIYNESRQAVNTNIPIQDISPFLRLLSDMDLNNFETLTLPGEPEYLNQAAYWIVNEKELEIVVNNFIRSKEYIYNGQYNLSILNGNGIPGQAGEVSSELRKYGFNVTRIANADNYNYQKTIIQYFDNENEIIAKKIRDLLGGELEFVSLEEDEERHEDISVIIGMDNLDEDKEL
ncbi:LCP family protein [Natronospora cellulosivora (SeqCode)]